MPIEPRSAGTRQCQSARSARVSEDECRLIYDACAPRAVGPGACGAARGGARRRAVRRGDLSRGIAGPPPSRRQRRVRRALQAGGAPLGYALRDLPQGDGADRSRLARGGVRALLHAGPMGHPSLGPSPPRASAHRCRALGLLPHPGISPTSTSRRPRTPAGTTSRLSSAASCAPPSADSIAPRSSSPRSSRSTPGTAPRPQSSRTDPGDTVPSPRKPSARRISPPGSNSSPAATSPAWRLCSDRGRRSSARGTSRLTRTSSRRADRTIERGPWS